MKIIDELKNTVVQGDCLEVMKGIPDKSIDMILCDLPYGTTACKWDTIIPFEPLWKQYKRVIKDNGAIVLTASQPFTTVLANSNLSEFRYEYIWIKSKATNFQNARRMPLKKHENVLVFYRSLPTYNQINLVKLGKPIKSSRKNKGANHNLDGFTDKEYYLTETGFNNSILEFSLTSVKGHLHPTQKPVALFEYLIKTYSNEGELILDNCAGSGTTGVACQNLNRNYILIEKEQEYIDIINQRLNKE